MVAPPARVLGPDGLWLSRLRSQQALDYGRVAPQHSAFSISAQELVFPRDFSDDIGADIRSSPGSLMQLGKGCWLSTKSLNVSTSSWILSNIKACHLQP